MSSVHDSADAGSAPCSGSVALPAKEIVSATFHVSDEDGDVIEATGG